MAFGNSSDLYTIHNVIAYVSNRLSMFKFKHSQEITNKLDNLKSLFHKTLLETSLYDAVIYFKGTLTKPTELLSYLAEKLAQSGISGEDLLDIANITITLDTPEPILEPQKTSKNAPEPGIVTRILGFFRRQQQVARQIENLNGNFISKMFAYTIK